MKHSIQIIGSVILVFSFSPLQAAEQINEGMLLAQYAPSGVFAPPAVPAAPSPSVVPGRQVAPPVAPGADTARGARSARGARISPPATDWADSIDGRNGYRGHKRHMRPRIPPGCIEVPRCMEPPEWRYFGPEGYRGYSRPMAPPVAPGAPFAEGAPVSPPAIEWSDSMKSSWDRGGHRRPGIPRCIEVPRCIEPPEWWYSGPEGIRGPNGW